MLLLLKRLPVSVFPFCCGPVACTRALARCRRHPDTSRGEATSCPVIAGGDSARRGPSGRRIGKHDRAPGGGRRRTRCDRRALAPRRTARRARAGLQARTVRPAVAPRNTRSRDTLRRPDDARKNCLLSASARSTLGVIPGAGLQRKHPGPPDVPGAQGLCGLSPFPAPDRPGHWAAYRPRSPCEERAFGHALNRCGHWPT
jgi:hypothetical protein